MMFEPNGRAKDTDKMKSLISRLSAADDLLGYHQTRAKHLDEKNDFVIEGVKQHSLIVDGKPVANCIGLKLNR